jgi:adenylate cyclase
LLKFLSGRYPQPRREIRAFIFIDVRDSTSIAERIGDFRFHAYINEAMSLVDNAAMDTGGEVHDYIGDQAMLIWAASNANAKTASPLAFFILLEERLSKAQARFRGEFGEELAFRAAAHARPVSVGEIGDIKQKIVYLGDTVNTAARLEQIARERDERAILTEQVLARWPLPPTLTATRVGAFQLRGKAEAVEVFRLERAEPGSCHRERQAPRFDERPHQVFSNSRKHADARSVPQGHGTRPTAHSVAVAEDHIGTEKANPGHDPRHNLLGRRREMLHPRCGTCSGPLD